MAQRSARREARPRAEADAGHRKRALCFRFPHERPNEHSPYRMANDSCNARPISLQSAMQRGCTQTNYDRSEFSFHIITADSPETTCSGLSAVFSDLQN